jgi:hypothetical protein
MLGVHDALQHLVLLIFSAGFSAVGWYMAHNPERIYRIFTFGIQPEQKFFVGFCRVCGWIFTVGFAVGVLMYLGLIAYDLL